MPAKHCQRYNLTHSLFPQETKIKVPVISISFHLQNMRLFSFVRTQIEVTMRSPFGCFFSHLHAVFLQGKFPIKQAKENQRFQGIHLTIYCFYCCFCFFLHYHQKFKSPVGGNTHVSAFFVCIDLRECCPQPAVCMSYIMHFCSCPAHKFIYAMLYFTVRYPRSNIFN